MAQSDPRPHTRTGRDAVCPHCGSVFWLYKSAENRGRTYCSLACSTAARRALTYNDEAQTRRCAKCLTWKSFWLFGKATGPKNERRHRLGELDLLAETIEKLSKVCL